jgi:hypothetical protein
MQATDVGAHRETGCFNNNFVFFDESCVCCRLLPHFGGDLCWLAASLSTNHEGLLSAALLFILPFSVANKICTIIIFITASTVASCPSKPRLPT